MRELVPINATESSCQDLWTIIQQAVDLPMLWPGGRWIVESVDVKEGSGFGKYYHAKYKKVDTIYAGPFNALTKNCFELTAEDSLHGILQDVMDLVSVVGGVWLVDKSIEVLDGGFYKVKIFKPSILK